MGVDAVRVWAHRGASGYAPENTLEAFALAVAQKADGVELDVHLTADGEVVVAHDETVDRVSDGVGRIADLSLAALKVLNFNRTKPHYAPVARIPTLCEALALLAPTGLTVNIELKTNLEPYPGLEARCIALVAKAGMRERVWYSSFNPESLARVKAIDSSLRCGILLDGAMDRPWLYARSLGVEALHPRYRTALRTPGFVRSCHEAGLRLHTWTVDAAPALRAMARIRPDAVITNYPDRALRILRH
jgi:glycerophosphoryl diester phosphodiesterase